MGNDKADTDGNISYVLLVLSVFLFRAKNAGLLNGAEYGIEASIITTVVLGAFGYVILKVEVSKRGIS